MKYTLVIAAFVAAVSAQESGGAGGIASLLAGFPSCSTKCFSENISTVMGKCGDKLSDVNEASKCICELQDFQDTVAKCVKDACKEESDECKVIDKSLKQCTEAKVKITFVDPPASCNVPKENIRGSSSGDSSAANSASASGSAASAEATAAATGTSVPSGTASGTAPAATTSGSSANAKFAVSGGAAAVALLAFAL